MPDDTRYWPLPKLKPETDWDECDHDLFQFMGTAYIEGFKPRLIHGFEPEAGEPDTRQVTLVFRGSRNGWEPFLEDRRIIYRLGPRFGLDVCSCIVVRPFSAASHLALQWLRGASLDVILKDFIFLGGSPSAITLHGPGIVS
jgi:hypothetical protein